MNRSLSLFLVLITFISCHHLLLVSGFHSDLAEYRVDKLASDLFGTNQTKTPNHDQQQLRELQRQSALTPPVGGSPECPCLTQEQLTSELDEDEAKQAVFLLKNKLKTAEEKNIKYLRENMRLSTLAKDQKKKIVDLIK